MVVTPVWLFPPPTCCALLFSAGKAQAQERFEAIDDASVVILMDDIYVID